MFSGLPGLQHAEGDEVILKKLGTHDGLGNTVLRKTLVSEMS